MEDCRSLSMSTMMLSDNSAENIYLSNTNSSSMVMTHGEKQASSSTRIALDRWTRFTEALLEMHPDRDFSLRDCWQREVSGRLITDRSSTLGLPDLFTDSVSGGHDILEKVWRPKKFSRPHRRFNQIGSKSRSGSRCMLHPDGSKRMLWALLGLIFIALDVFFLTMAVFGVDRPTAVMLLDGLYWSADIGVNFCIGLYIGDRLEARHFKVAKHYLRTWFFADVLLVVVQWILVVLDAGRPGAGLVRYIRLARFLRLVRLAKFNRNLRQLLLAQARWANLLLKMALYLVSVALWVHLSATIFFWIGDQPGGWTWQEPEFRTFPMSYLISVHWAASQLQGGIDVHPVYSTSERSFAVLNLLASVAVLAMVVSKVTNVLHAMQLANRDRNRVTLAARRFLERNDVRSELSLQIYRYLAKREVVKARMGDDDDEREMLHRLPSHLRRTLLQEARWPMVNRHILFVAFASSNNHFKQLLLCDVLQCSVYLPDDLIFQYGAACTRMYLVVYGECHYLRYGRTFVSLMANGRARSRTQGKLTVTPTARNLADEEDEEGILHSSISSVTGSAYSHEGSDSASSYEEDFATFQARHRQLQGCRVRRNTTLAEAVLWTNWAHAGDFEAVNETPIYHINVHEFEDLVCNFGKVQQDLRNHAHRFLEFLNEADGEKYSDLLSTDMVMEAAYAATKSRASHSGADLRDTDTSLDEETNTVVLDSERFSINRKSSLDPEPDLAAEEACCCEFSSEGLTTKQQMRVGL